MTIKLEFRPRETIIWAEFSEKFPRYSIAVDGFCSGPPMFDDRRRVLNINHHEGVDTMATRSSCDQAYVAVVEGLYESFSHGGKPHATVWCNDCDQDVTMATFILCHPETVNSPKLRQLVRVADLMDQSMGLLPHKSRWTLMRQLAWANEPYTKARIRGRLHQMTGKQMATLVRSVHRRLMWLLDAEHDHHGEIEKRVSANFDTRYEVISRQPTWVFVREIGEQSRIGMSEDGIKAFVSLVSQNDGTYHYTLGRLSRFIMFPQLEAYEALNAAEGIGSDEIDRWGGSLTGGGSPRSRGSKMPPLEVARIIDDIIKRWKKNISA